MQRCSVLGVLLLLCLASTLANAAPVSWRSLSPEQREALAPLVQQWDTLPELLRNRLIGTAKRYPHLNAEQKRRYHERLEKWSKLTPEQRKAAREKYRAFNKVPADKREQVKRKFKEEQASRTPQSEGANNSAALPTAPSH